MGGAVKSAGGFLGTSSGPQISAQNGNQSQDILNNANGIYSLGDTAKGFQDYTNGKSLNDTLSDYGNSWAGADGSRMNEFQNALATNPLTGSKMATDQVQNNAILGGLFGQSGQLNKAESKLDDLNNQGFELKPEDMTQYGQTSGNIARMFGQQGNQVSQDLASRGLASAPSGAAGAMFSGLAGNQNEMLAQAQQQIMQQRFANTQNQIQAQQNFIGQLGQQGANAINQQYGRQLSGAQNQTQGLSQAAGLQTGANAQANQSNLAASNFNVANTPQNFADFGTAGLGQGIQSMAGGGMAGMFSGGGASPTTAKSMGAGSGAMSGSSGMMSAAAIA